LKEVEDKGDVVEKGIEGCFLVGEGVEQVRGCQGHDGGTDEAKGPDGAPRDEVIDDHESKGNISVVMVVEEIVMAVVGVGKNGWWHRGMFVG
jgi:hypothetical protein